MTEPIIIECIGSDIDVAELTQALQKANDVNHQTSGERRIVVLGGGSRRGMLGSMLSAHVSLIAAMSIRVAEELVFTAGPRDDLMSLVVKDSDFNSGGAFKPVLDYPIRQLRMKVRAPYGAMKNRKYR